MFYKVIIGCFEPLDQSGFLVIKTFAMSTYVLYQKARLLNRFPEPLPDPPHPSPDFQGVSDTFAISSCYRKHFFATRKK